MSNKALFEEYDEGQSKLAKKIRDSPFVVIGVLGFTAVGLWGAYKYKSRGTMSTSQYLMQLRVAAQGTAVGCLTLGLVYSMFNEYVLGVKHKKTE